MTTSPTLAFSSAVASGERHDTRSSPESSSSIPTIVTTRSSPDLLMMVTVAPKNTRSGALPALSTTSALSRLFERCRMRRSISRSFRLP